jgi:SAM-dependent methyltransferase
MHFLQQPLQSLFLAFPDGIPLRVATSMLPWKSKWHLHSYLHLHLQQRVVKKERASEHSVSFTPQKMKNLVRSLRTAIESYRLEKKTGVWSGYYQEASQRGNYLEQKTAIIESWASTRTFRTVLDTGANEGHFSNFFARKGAQVVAVDFDHFSVNQLFKKASEHAMPILPLVADLSEPSPAMGMNYDVRPAFVTRFKSDLVIALALIHHLAIGKYFSFDTIASFYATLGSFLIIEFVGPADEKVKNMLSQKHISFDWYTEDAFRIAFAKHFSMMEFKTIPGTNRTLYLLRNDATGTNT